MAQDKIKKKGRFYYARKTFDYFGVILLLCLLYGLWVLYRGPLSVPFLKPYIMQALNSENTQYTMNIGDVNLELVRSIQPIKIIAKDVNFRKNDDTFAVYTPNLSLSFSVRALLNGVIAPSSITAYQPQVSIFTTYGLEEGKSNELNKKKFELYVNWFERFLERFNADEKIYPESYVNEIKIQDASVEFHEVDLARVWHFKDVNFGFERHLMNLELSAGGVLDLEDRLASLNLKGLYKPFRNTLEVQTSFEDFLSSDLLNLNFNKAFQTDIPMDGKISLLLDFNEILAHRDNLFEGLDASLKDIFIHLEGGAGAIMFDQLPQNNYALDSFVLDGHAQSGLDHIQIQNATFETGEQKTVLSLDVTGYQKLLFENSIEDLKIKFTSEIDSFPIDDLSKFWPRYLAEPAWQWCKDNLSVGEAKNGKFTFEFGYDPKLKAFVFQKLEGEADVVDANISYLEDMPVVKKAYGKVRFSKSEIDINVHQGLSDGVKLQKGRVRIYDLDQNQSAIDIQLKGSSSIEDALNFINHQPLGFADELGLDTKTIKGDVDIDLGLNFELRQDLKPEDVHVSVKADLKNVAFAPQKPTHKFSAKNLSLEVNNQGFLVFGDALFDDIPVNLSVNDTFANRSYKAKANVKFKFNDDVKQKLGFKTSLLSAPQITGYADVEADVTVLKDDSAEVDVTADLLHSAIDYRFLGFVKPLQTEGQIKTKVKIHNDKISQVPYFALEKPDFKLNGKILFEKSGEIQTIDIEKIEGPKTSASAQIVLRDKKDASLPIQVKVHGSAYDLTPFFEEKPLTPDEKDSASESDSDLKTAPDTDIMITVGKLWTNDKTSIRNVTANASVRNGIGLDELHVFGNFGKDKSITLKLDYAPRPEGEHVFVLDSNNAGSTLRVLRLYENMSGGILKIEGKTDAENNFIGHARIRDFSIHETPVLTKILTLASLSGMVDLLTGEGLSFSHFDAPFEYKNKVFYINNANMFGNVLGLNGTGTIERQNKKINLQGIVSPAYGLNQIIGSIPIVGTILTGKDGKVFAINYSVSGNLENPKIEINPVAGVSPNNLPNVFPKQGQ